MDNKFNLRKLDYSTFQSFIESDKNEVEYFGDLGMSSGSELLSLDIYVAEFKKKRDFYMKEILPIVEQIKEKNDWLSKIVLYSEGQMILLGKQNYVGMDLRKIQGKDKFKNLHLFDMDFFPFSMITNMPNTISTAFFSSKVQKNSKKELLDIHDIATEMFLGYENKPTSSNVFAVNCATDSMEIMIHNGETCVWLGNANLEQEKVEYNKIILTGKFSDLPFVYTEELEVGNKFQYLDAESQNKFIKKIQIRRNS